MSAAICATGLVKRFGKTDVLNGLSFEAPQGSVFGLIGPNGAGKTTTIKLLMNFLQPSAGRAEVLGVDSRDIGPGELAAIGYVSENQKMPEWMTVEYLFRYLKPFYPTWDDARAAELTRQFELPLDRKLRQLSRGMKMKAALISSLAYHPRLLVLDEPFSGLDPVMREDLIEGILESAAETTIFISSHDLAEIESFASHIGYLANGRLQFAEEMSSLTARFRAVEVTLPQAAAIPPGPEWPGEWLRPEAVQTVVRFIESNYDSERTTGEIRRVFGEVRQISLSAMPLRAIFVALARSRAKAA